MRTDQFTPYYFVVDILDCFVYGSCRHVTWFSKSYYKNHWNHMCGIHWECNQLQCTNFFFHFKNFLFAIRKIKKVFCLRSANYRYKTFYIYIIVP
ncbi:Uncharacterized protein TCM_037842 [Theobroma cacao]|uniref:Uncharacterized protein n=1 Tax=Theobroma cacao TaxID=3641 RepID=A0A061GMJ5_THECC|nr:Uncharacterized protein TCM_037842 [Theobroma cacao]